VSRSFLWRRPVIKLGTSTLTAGTRDVSLARLAGLVEQVAQLQVAGVQPILVSSGAIAAGRQRLGHPREHKDVSFKQVLAAVGQATAARAVTQYAGNQWNCASRRASQSHHRTTGTEDNGRYCAEGQTRAMDASPSRRIKADDAGGRSTCGTKPSS